ncbi:LEM3/CDC50 family protein [Catenaria anguillulae PL171]|uniref:LEM3/CDC50 family protein n=1 Tax=Catenaria anguillulae PL171 TaxID=765915 RepID=A0A1Y2I3M2_9FUNG|nr:LEM3/CDC50 family protein [Catenaria anguillulae PL171]
MSDEKPKTRRPANTAFKQQRLKAWQPLLTPKSVLPTLFILGVIFAPLGAFLLHTSNSVSELIIDYTSCATEAASAGKVSFSAPGVSNPNINLRWNFARSNAQGANANTGTCTLEFDLPTTFQAPVFIYYRLTNFYQNHRRYVRSFDASQLRGTSPPSTSIVSNCNPLGLYPTNSTLNPPPAADAVYYPCGLIADSMFNDTINNPVRVSGGSQTPYEFSPKNIAWPADKSKYGKLKDFDRNKHLPPPNWVARFGNGSGRYDTAPPLDEDERFHVWMRTAGLPNFRKLYGRNDKDNLQQGSYKLEIASNFEVNSFGGTKSVVISTVSFMGGKNPFLGYAYIVVGAVCIFLAVVFAARHLYSPRKLGDHTYLSWNHQPPPSTNQ